MNTRFRGGLARQVKTPVLASDVLEPSLGTLSLSDDDPADSGLDSLLYGEDGDAVGNANDAFFRRRR